MSQCWEWCACEKHTRAALRVLIRSLVLPRSSSPCLLPTPNESRQALLLSLEKITSWDHYACQEAGRLWGLANLLTNCSRGNATNPRKEELSCSCDDLFLSSGQQPCAQPFWMRLVRWDILALAVKPVQAVFPQVKSHSPAVPLERAVGCWGQLWRRSWLLQ